MNKEGDTEEDMKKVSRSNWFTDVGLYKYIRQGWGCLLFEKKSKINIKKSLIQKHNNNPHTIQEIQMYPFSYFNK